VPSFDPCDYSFTAPVCLGAKVGGTVAEAIDFATDPLGYIAQKMQQAASELAGTVLPELEKLTHPDLSQDWFLSAYRVSFALSIFVWVAFLGWNFVQLARHRVSGDEVVETMGVYTPLFLGGVILGPPIGAMLLTLTGTLTDSLIDWGVRGSVGGTTQALQDAIVAGEADKIAGGAVVAIVFFFCLIVALILAFIVLLVMLVTLYLTGAILPLSLVWLTHPRQRSKGLKVLMVWVGVCFSHVLLFLLLGVAFRMVTGLSTSFDDESGLTVLVNLAVAVIALFMATLSPLGLLRFAPVGPSVAAVGGPSLSLPGRHFGGGYPVSGDDSQTAQLARTNDSYGSYGDGDAGGPGGAGPGGGSGGGGAQRGGLLGLLRSGRDDGESSAAMEPDGGGRAESGAGAEDDAADPAPAASTQADPAPAPSAAATAGTAARGGQASTASTAQMAAEVSAGVFGPVGVAVAATGAALSTTAQLAQSAGELAAEQMEHGTTYPEGGPSADPRPRR
jgi:type IV secretion system protein TrbL